MDSALILKQKVDKKEITSYKEAKKYLDKSELMKRLLSDFNIDALNLLNRLIELAEIPFTCHIKKVNKWREQLAELSFCEEGFSLTGDKDYLLPCYNSMIKDILIRLEYSNIRYIKKGIDWIIKYQNVERGLENKWKGKGILKYGGCMKDTPCYIGVVKSMIALSNYRKQNYYERNDLLENKLRKGLNEILNHKIYKRKSDGEPITKDILKLSYPFTYKINLVEILKLIKDNDLIANVNCLHAKEHLISKRRKNGYWKTNSIYLPKNWIQFDKPKEPGLWITYEIEKILN